ncbi:DNA oxidative demethylase ALKBH2 isoform X2 [Ictidomys tridecemlineatus]|uniref:DNA oxidative demethylase ALKBH2 isoform X2 n=1 Tax=Ictidomys tridecemlineatus TaxID=43179 RepID=UPI001A9F53D0|nr:DNA oxidative demethylase ALKBH2 isoform X2 [Ictidomys tridecemlineatus]
MDRFLGKEVQGSLLGKPEEQEQSTEEGATLGDDKGHTRKRPRRDPPGNAAHLAGPSWRHIRAEGLDCDYTVLFGKTEADEIFRQLEEKVEYFTGALARVQVFGKWHSVPRKQATYGDAGLTYTFSGLTLSPKPWIPVLECVRDRVSGLTGHTFNFVLVNRDFCFRHKDSRGKNPHRKLEVIRLQLAHGSLLMMNPPTNAHWYHSLPVRKKVLAPRVNLTFRKILPKK